MANKGARLLDADDLKDFKKELDQLRALLKIGDKSAVKAAYKDVEFFDPKLK
jgi:hypothetical protein